MEKFGTWIESHQTQQFNSTAINRVIRASSTINILCYYFYCNQMGFFTVAPSSSPSASSSVNKNVGPSSPLERNGLASLDQKLAMAKRCSHEGVVAGAKAAVVASIVAAVPTLASVRMLPWARSYLNPTAQALIISTVAGSAYFIVADKSVLASARKNSYKQSPGFEA